MATKHTHGGFPVESAYRWEDKTYKALGSILHRLYSNEKQVRWIAESDYFELKRYFVADVFEEYIDKLDKFRIENGFDPVRDMIKFISDEKVKNREPEVHRYNSDLPKAEAQPVKVERQKEIIHVEQMSLF